MTIGVALAGACGRMGKGIIREVTKQPDMELVFACDIDNIGSDAGLLAGVGPLGVRIESPDGLSDGLKDSGARIFVDFSNHDAALKNSQIAADAGCGLVIGTTGLKTEDLDITHELVKEKGVSAVISPNMATGVNVYFKLVRDAAKALGGEYDVEIIEAHHRHKKDAPSGTALKAAEYIAKALGREIELEGIYGRKGVVGERSREEIGMHAIRGGDIVGDHTVMFAGDGERIEITHRAHSREAFVSGVIKAIRFLMEKNPEGRVYSMWDVLGLE